VQLKLESSDGKKHNTDCTHSEGLLRIIQTIPSPEAEPFKRRLAKVGYERLKEIENPELASKRARENYKAKGYSDNWIEKRMRSIVIREELTDGWISDIKSKVQNPLTLSLFVHIRCNGKIAKHTVFLIIGLRQ
jgi:hypothetical protein